MLYKHFSKELSLKILLILPWKSLQSAGNRRKAPHKAEEKGLDNPVLQVLP